MRQLFMLVVLVLAVTGVVSGAAAQTPDDVTRLKSEIEILRKQMKNLEKENELLKREIELMKREAKPKPDAPKGPKTDAKSRTKTSNFGIDFELVKCVRNPTKRTRITFTFAARPQEEERNNWNLGVCKRLNLLTSDLKEFKAATSGGVKLNGPLNGKIVNGPSDTIVLKKGEWAKFQITFEGVDEEATEFNQVELYMGSKMGFSRLDAVRFSGIKIESEKPSENATDRPPERKPEALPTVTPTLPQTKRSAKKH